MATKEPLRRCVRCKTKKKGCSRGSPCERCALAGLTADECIYLESDATFRNIKPKRKDTTTYTLKASVTKISRTISTTGADPNAIVRCSRCIRTARGCSHERPCEPCREHGLSEWECRYTSASSFKVRGPGAGSLRKVKSMEKLPTIALTTMTSSQDAAIRKVLKTERSHSTNSAPTAFAQRIIDQIPSGYRTPSPPTNISPISEPPNWADRDESLSPLRDMGLFSRAHVSDAPGENDIVTDKAEVGAESESTSMSRTNSGTGIPAVASADLLPHTMSLMPSRSQQSHANTIPDSSPVVYTDDYQSSPSPYNSPQFQSSPPVHFQQVSGSSQRPSSYPTESALSAPQAQYRSYAMHGHSRQVALPFSASHQGFAIPQLSQPHQAQQAQNYHQMWNYANSPPYPQYQQLPHFTAHGQAYAQQMPRHRAVASPAPRYANAPSPYAIPSRQSSYESRQQPSQEQYRRADQTHPQSIPRPGFNQRRIESFNNQSVSSKDGSPVRGAQSNFKMTLQRDPSRDSNGDYETGIFEQDITWQDSDIGEFPQDEQI